jgi:hypothetical protein
MVVTPRICLAILVLALGTACGIHQPGMTPAGAYSVAFWQWINQSLVLRSELEELQRQGRVGAQEDLQARIEQLRLKQAALNQPLLQASPPSDWVPFHARIVAALNTYAAATEVLFASGPPPAGLLDLLAVEQARLRERVTVCYAQSPACG